MAKQVATKKKSPGAKAKKARRAAGVRAALAALVICLVLVGGAYVALCAMVDQSVLLPNTEINGVALGGLTRTQAQEALQEDFRSDYQGAAVTVSLEGEEYTVSLWDEERNVLTLDTGTALDEAMERGHGSFFTRGLDWLSAHITPWSGEVLPQVSDQAGLREAIAGSGIEAVDTASGTTYEVGEQSVTFTKGTDGVVADVETLAGQITDLVSSGAALGGGVIDSATLGSTAAALDVQEVYDEVYTDPQDATLDPENGYAIVDSVDGVSLDVEAAQAALEAAAPGETVTVDLVFTEPEITTQELEECLFRDELGSYTTSVSGSSGRRENVRLAAEFCDGVILMPGEVFNYNDVVGERTTARGFSAAPAYLNGETVQEVGGGICQVSSTLYAACLYSNLEIVTRVNHTYASSYIGLGLDATVSWGGPEYEFANNTDYPIRVDASYSGGQLSISIRGTKTDDIRVEMVSETLEVIPAGTGEGSHHTGYKVQTYRNLYDGDGNLISSTPEAYSSYRAS